MAFRKQCHCKLDVIDFLTTLKKAQQYKSIKIIDSKGNELLSLGENLTLAINNRQSLLELMNRPYVRKIRHNIYSQGESGFEIVIPYILIDRMQEAMGAVLIAFDPKTYLTQNFNTWLRSHPGRKSFFAARKETEPPCCQSNHPETTETTSSIPP